QGTSSIYTAYDNTFSQPTHVWGTTPEQWLTYNTSVAGRPLQTSSTVASPANVVTNFGFTTDGRMQSQTDAAGHGSTMVFGSPTFQNLTSVTELTSSGSKMTRIAYDVFGRDSAVTDPTGAVTTSVYNTLNLPIKTVGARGESTLMYYDIMGRDTLVVDPLGNRYISYRNALGWVTSQLDPAGLTSRTSYDMNGNVLSFQNRRNQLPITATYDALDRVASKTLMAENQTTTYAYDPVAHDPAGQWVVVSNGVSTDTVRLNTNFQVAQQQTARSGFTRSVRASYDLNSQRTGVNVLRNGMPADSIKYTYGSAGELMSIVDPLGFSTSLTYNNEHLVQYTNYAGGFYAANTYSSSHELVGRTYPTVPALDVAFGRTYVVDSLSRIHESRMQDTVRRYGYDASGELISQGDWQRVVGGCYNDPDYGYRCAYTGEVPVAGSIHSYGYDLVGNPTDAGTMIMTGNRMTQFGGDAIMYDSDGNVIQRQRIGSPSTFNQVLTWNSASQLTAVTTTRNGVPTTLQFAYDGNGRRIQKTVVGGAVTHYVWDGDQIVAETDASGNTQRLYTYFPGTDQLNSVVTGGKTYYAAQDAAGNVVGMIDWTQLSAKDKYTYQPFGTMDQNDQNVPNSMRWKGLLYDAESGLYYVRARYYAPEMRRFLSEDPIGLDGGINQYRFAENDPVNNGDPSGLESCPEGQYEGWYELYGVMTPRCLGTAKPITVTAPYTWSTAPAGAGSGLLNNAQVPSWDQPSSQSAFRGGASVVTETNWLHNNISKRQFGQGACASHVRQALCAGGLIDACDGGPNAKAFGPFLEGLGFQPLGTRGYLPQRGDVGVMVYNPYGHVAEYDGTKWVSDFVQRQMQPNGSAHYPYTIYRRP
ncbi:MAG: RhsA, partial [Gemmatimonadetes bacterium]|nr:RhsA [Gemmatimonadota bacterium]